MSRLKNPEPVKLLSSIFSGDISLISSTIKALSDTFGSVDYISALIPFDYTGYYEKEMGYSLKRRFITFEKLMRPEMLPDVKHRTNEIEEDLSAEGNRRVNIDPGYLSQAHLILATGKAYTHRPYLRDGIYADVTLIYKNNSFQPLEWTYPDYAGEIIKNMLQTIRKKYFVELKRR